MARRRCGRRATALAADGGTRSMTKTLTSLILLVAFCGSLSACGGSSPSGGEGAVSADTPECFTTKTVTLPTDGQLLEDEATGAFSGTPTPAALPMATSSSIHDVHTAVADHCISTATAKHRFHKMAHVDG